MTTLELLKQGKTFEDEKDYDKAFKTYMKALNNMMILIESLKNDRKRKERMKKHAETLMEIMQSIKQHVKKDNVQDIINDMEDDLK
jgi:glucosamine 6-phosphate synthetase-like amidotransferase/phosphosugar isomerase protein